MNRKKRRMMMTAMLGAMTVGLAGCGSSADIKGSAPAAETEVKKASAEDRYFNAHVIAMSGDTATLDGVALESYDYTWHCDPSTAHDEVKNAPAEYYTGTKPETEAAAYIDHELYYYPMIDESLFTLENYDGEREWVTYYTDGENENYIFGTLPLRGESVPAQMMHTEEEAAANQVLHITQAGEYILQGEWKGQIVVDLGDEEEVYTDDSARVTLILDNADIECTVAPGVIFKSVYECDNAWEEREEYSAKVDTSEAGATVILADGTENTITGTNVFRMLKTKYKNEDEEAEEGKIRLQKKMRKTDGALYSYMSMNIKADGDETGALTVTSGFEGIDTELHLSVCGGNVTVYSQDDGINVNEDNVSSACFLGGKVTLHAALGDEGDGIDSNGFIWINGGTIESFGIRRPDSTLDSEDGALYESGTVIEDGEEKEYTPGEVIREFMGGPGGGFPGGFKDGERPEFNGEIPKDRDGKEPPEGFKDRNGKDRPFPGKDTEKQG